MRFLGTAAADVIPNPFCTCKICQAAREHPKDVRLRSAFLLDEKNLIDFGPDLAAEAIRCGIDLAALERVFITHTHQDHFCLSNAGLLHMSLTRSGAPLDIYLSEAAYQAVSALYTPVKDIYLGLDEVNAYRKGEIRFCPVKAGEAFSCGEYRVLAVESPHKAAEFENCINYMFEDKTGKKLLYACDTGLYSKGTLERLKDSEIDTLVLEATWGSLDDGVDIHSHLNAKAFLQMLEQLLAYRIIRKDTAVYATHINHKHDFTHADYQAWFDQNAQIPVKVAYDGLEIQ